MALLGQWLIPISAAVALAAAILLYVGDTAVPPTAAAAPPMLHDRWWIPSEHHRVRWALYQREHRTTTRLGRRVRAQLQTIRVLRSQLAKARRVQAARHHAEVQPSLPPHYQQWLCIHQYEGGWTANTGNGYYGGLQEDMNFQRAYAPELLASKGTADHWTPLEQMWAAERAYQSGRGFWPWPNTARMCGLLP